MVERLFQHTGTLRRPIHKFNGGIFMKKSFAGSVSLSEDAVSHPGFSDFQEDFRNQVEFFKGLAAMGGEPALEKDITEEEEKLDLFIEAREKLFLEAMEEIEFSEDEDAGEKLARLAMYLYLEDITETIGRSILSKKAKVGVVSLFGTWRSRLSGFLSWGYFEKPMSAVMDEYISSEPQLVALGEIAGVKIGGIQEVLEEYADDVADRLPIMPEDLPES